MNRIPMVRAHDFSQTETLTNGACVTIRAIRPSDKAGIAAAFSQLDPDSVYTPFFQAKGALSDRELDMATNVDFQNVVALVATIVSEGKEKIVGGGRYVAFDCSPTRRSAEIAFTVEENYRRQGIASHVLKCLAQIARENGLDQFEAEVLPQNKAMLSVFSRSGLPMRKSEAYGVVQVILSLKEGFESGKWRQRENAGKSPK